MSTMFDRLAHLDRRYDELTQLLGDPEVASNPDKLMEYGRERSDLDEVVTTWRELREMERQIADAEQMARDDDPEMAEMRSEEHTSELQSPCNLVCRLLLETKKKQRELVRHDV